MGIFGKSQQQKWIEAHGKKLSKIREDGCVHSGVLVMLASLEPSYSSQFNNISDLVANYHLQADGLIHLCATRTPDEFEDLKVIAWGLGYDGINPDTIYFRCVLMPWVFAIHQQNKGDAKDWFEKNYKANKMVMGPPFK